MLTLKKQYDKNDKALTTT